MVAQTERENEARPSTGIRPGRRPRPRPAQATAGARPEPSSSAIAARARFLWPRLDGHRLSKAHGDPIRIAHLVEQRTALPLDTIMAMLLSDAPPKPPSRREVTDARPVILAVLGRKG